jgi:hypothetical protein
MFEGVIRGVLTVHLNKQTVQNRPALRLHCEFPSGVGWRSEKLGNPKRALSRSTPKAGEQLLQKNVASIHLPAAQPREEAAIAGEPPAHEFCPFNGKSKIDLCQKSSSWSRYFAANFIGHCG